MLNKDSNFKNKKELDEKILQAKAEGIPDLEIGRKYGVTFRYIERLVTKSKGVNISALKVQKRIRTLHPKQFEEEQTTVWSFRQRGNWATHSGEYRGNWSPYIPRNVILKYSEPGELILDYFCGAGTTAVESKLLGRNCVAFDINNKAIELARGNVNFHVEQPELHLLGENSHLQIFEPKLSVGDARDLSFLRDDSVDLICAHPPYANIIHYTDSRKDDLSFFDIEDFLEEMSKVAKESLRVLKPGRQCAILIGDTRRKKHVIPLGFKLINVYLSAGFRLKELVIKRQHNCKTTGFWYANSLKYNFLLLAHEYLPILEKPEPFITPSTREEAPNYHLIRSMLEKPFLGRKLDEFETTTVWILPKEDFDAHLNRNIIDRYSSGGNYSVIALCPKLEHEKSSIRKESGKHQGLLFLRSPCLNNQLSSSGIEFYLREMNETIERNLPRGNGFLVIQTQDVRMNGYIEPLAKKIVDMLMSNGDLWLKEIIVVTQQGLNARRQDSGDHLEIVHQYLLVYDVKR